MLSDREVAELRSLCRQLPPRPAQLVERLIVDTLALEARLSRERERALQEIERLRDVLARAHPLLPVRVDDEIDALLAEVEDALSRRRW